MDPHAVDVGQSRILRNAGSQINDAGDTIATRYSEGTAAAVIDKLVNGQWQPVRGMPYRTNEYRDDGAGGVSSNDGAVLTEACDAPIAGGISPRSYVRDQSGPNWTIRETIPLVIPEAPDESVQHFSLAIGGTGNTIVAQVNQWPANPFYFDLPSEVQVFTRVSGAYSKLSALPTGRLA